MTNPQQAVDILKQSAERMRLQREAAKDVSASIVAVRETERQAQAAKESGTQ